MSPARARFSAAVEAALSIYERAYVVGESNIAHYALMLSRNISSSLNRVVIASPSLLSPHLLASSLSAADVM